ncbi:MAG: hypothetical protein V9F06_01680 [Thermomicrobiales bacterium]
MPVIERYARHWSRRPRWVAASLIGTALLTLAIAQLAILSAAADAPATAAFQRTWARTDQPVTSGQANRTWMWGPSANTGPLQEPYADAPGGVRTVQYFDKSRMEDNSWRATAPWDVTNGLLVVEMVTGQMQVGDTQFQPLAPAVVNIAGDPGEHPTYADINTFNLQSQPATPVGTVLTTWMDATGILPSGPTPPSAVTAAERLTVTGIDHTVASVFWTFMNSSGTVFENGQYVQGPLFENPYYATGYPITEAYWSTVKIGGTPQTVLWQCFQRRCLTYNPANGPGWQVEAGNVGQHYYQWRTASTPIEPTPTSTTVPGQPTMTPTPTNTVAPGQPTNTVAPATKTTVPATKTTAPATSTTVPATSTTVPATSTTVPATSTTPPQQSYLSVKVVDKDGKSQLPAGVVVTSNTLTAYQQAGGDVAGQACNGTQVGTFTLNTTTFTASKVMPPGNYCVELSAQGYLDFGGTRYSGSLFSSGLGTVTLGNPAGNTNVTIKVTMDNVKVN